MHSAKDFIKSMIELLLGAIIIGSIGAFALTMNFRIAGAVCFLIAGFLFGLIIGFVIANVDDSGNDDDILR